MNDHVHPLFRDILNGIAMQPAQLVRAAKKAEPRRFTGEGPSGYGDLDERFPEPAELVDEEAQLQADMQRDMQERAR